MKGLIFCILLFISFNSAAQKVSVTDAYNRFKIGDYNGAIKLYRENLKEDPPQTLPYLCSMIGQCYLKLDSIDNAKQAFLSAININKTGDFFASLARFESSNFLAGIYFKEKDYRKALNYYKSSVDTLRKAHLGEFVGPSFMLTNNFQQGRCYLELNLIDSAIIEMTPQVFHARFDPKQYGYSTLTKTDSLQDANAIGFYLTLLQKKYSSKQLKKEFELSEEHFEFTETTERKTMNYLYKHTVCSTYFLGMTITFFEQTAGLPEDAWPQHNREIYLDKDYQLDRYKELPISKLIQALPN